MRCWRGRAAARKPKFSYNGNLLTENRNGLIVDTELFQATGTAERDAAMVMLEQIPGRASRHGGS